MPSGRLTHVCSVAAHFVALHSGVYSCSVNSAPSSNSSLAQTSVRAISFFHVLPPHSPVYTMDPASMRPLACAANRPLGQVFDVIVESYLEEHRSATMLDTTLEPPVNRCVMKVGRGRCRKPVTRVAVVQFCWKHQPGGGICFPGDSKVCYWNRHGYFRESLIEPRAYRPRVV